MFATTQHFVSIKGIRAEKQGETVKIIKIFKFSSFIFILPHEIGIISFHFEAVLRYENGFDFVLIGLVLSVKINLYDIRRIY